MRDQAAEEGVGAHFDAAMLLETRKRTFDVIARVGAEIAPGMSEEEGVALTKARLSEAELARGWHGVYVRFGKNTLKNYDEASEPGVVLGANDICFIDIGPVWRQWEGDGGDTFVFGDDPDMHAAKRDVHVLFDRAHTKWRAEKPSGEALYAFAGEEAERMGWRLNLGLASHRLSDFPHYAFHRGTLAAAPYTPSAGLWVLEMHIRHPTRAIGAFYEDLLLDDPR